MFTRVGRITLVLLAFIIMTALAAGCSPSTPAPTQAPAATEPAGQPLYPSAPTETQPAAVGQQATEVPQTPESQPTTEGQQAAEPTQAVGTAYPGTGGSSDNGYPGAGGPSGVQSVPNQAKLVAQFMEQKPGPNAEQVILRVKVVSAQPAQNSSDFVSQLVDQEVELVANTDGLPQLAANDTFEAVVSLQGDEKNQQYFASEIKKQ